MYLLVNWKNSIKPSDVFIITYFKTLNVNMYMEKRVQNNKSFYFLAKIVYVSLTNVTLFYAQN